MLVLVVLVSVPNRQGSWACVANSKCPFKRSRASMADRLGTTDDGPSGTHELWTSFDKTYSYVTWGFAESDQVG